MPSPRVNLTFTWSLPTPSAAARLKTICARCPPINGSSAITVASTFTTNSPRSRTISAQRAEQLE